MDIRLLIADFDGSMTDAWAEGRGFVAGYKVAIQILTGLDEGTFKALHDGFTAAMTADPHLYGVLNEDKIVTAPAVVDPYLFMQTIARLIFDREGRFVNPIDRKNVIEYMFVSNYAKTSTVPRLGAPEFMRAASEHGFADFCIVTNARTRSVQKKLTHMGIDADTTSLYGDAQKFKIGPVVDVPERINILGENPNGHVRWVYPGRIKYYELLNRLREYHGLQWSEVCIVGDIFELDLALPFFLGCQVVLLVNDHTPQYEIDWLYRNGEGRAHVFGDLNDARMHLLGK
jgi:hypothetical protein